MKITSCLLDTDNKIKVGPTTIGNLITQSGKDHLWSNRTFPHIDTVVLHYMSAIESAPATPYDLGEMLKRLCEFGVSAHYLIDRSGEIVQLVPEDKKAWHAGGSIMPSPDDRRNVNDFSIGIELVATPEADFDQAQYQSLVRLCKNIESRYGKNLQYVGHDTIAGDRAVKLGLRTLAKNDPGPYFGWTRFTSMMLAKHDCD